MLIFPSCWEAPLHPSLRILTSIRLCLRRRRNNVIMMIFPSIQVKVSSKMYMCLRSEINLRVSDVPEAVTKLLKEDSVVFGIRDKFVYLASHIYWHRFSLAVFIHFKNKLLRACSLYSHFGKSLFLESRWKVWFASSYDLSLLVHISLFTQEN